MSPTAPATIRFTPGCCATSTAPRLSLYGVSRDPRADYLEAVNSKGGCGTLCCDVTHEMDKIDDILATHGAGG
jgi:hypothetical protein